MHPKVSIITVCYNAETLIERTIQSVINQTYPHIEYIIVDGNSTDNTLQTINELISGNPVGVRHTERLQIQIISEPDTGIYDAMNKGLTLATGDYVWFMNAGDEIYEPTTLEKLIPCFEKNADVVYGDTVMVDESRNILGFRKKRPPKNFTWKTFRKGMMVCHQSILVSRKIAPKYDLQYKIAADIDWVIQLMKRAQIVCNSNEILSRFLIDGFSKQREKSAWKERFTIMKKHYGLLQTLVFHAFIGIRYIFK
ncbi:MAG: glycosyltransferase [Bacteroidales bacterium]|nr:glycosyltransferase [Bacteroidales bacterium]